MSRMDVAERSSSNELSSAPNSDVDGPTSNLNHSNTITVSRNATSTGPLTSKNSGNVLLHGGAGDRQDTLPKQRKPRKKKDSDVTVTPTEKKDKVTRRPRGASTATGSTRKKLKTETPISTPSLQHTTVPITPESAYSRPSQQHSIENISHPNSATNEAAKFSQNGFLNNNSTMPPQKPPPSQYKPTPPPPPPPVSTPVPRSMAYDPVRSLTMPRNTEPSPSINITHSSFNIPPRNSYNPSTSPAISSIINPPEINPSQSKIPTTYQPQAESRPQPTPSIVQSKEENTAMEIDDKQTRTEIVKKATPEVIPAKPATKPRSKEQPPPLPTGSGLLSSTLFGGDSGMDANKSTNDKGTSIVLHVDLKDPNNKVINFARMAEEKYGFAALYPRQAAQKERLAKVAAAGAALERAGAGIKGTPAGESGDESVSVDIDRDSENDGDVTMSGLNGTGEALNSGTDGPLTKRRKRKDEYDADDPFVDDSEMLWEAQAAASKDGFFVYCGPLVPEGEKPTVERADGTVKRGRGRGRGGGPGSRGGRGAAAAARDADGGAGRGGSSGGGPGSRGSGITRKPRITKAERAQREIEKKQREQMAPIAARPSHYQP